MTPSTLVYQFVISRARESVLIVGSSLAVMLPVAVVLFRAVSLFMVMNFVPGNAKVHAETGSMLVVDTVLLLIRPAVSVAVPWSEPWLSIKIF